MIDFYTWTTPNGHKIAIALEEMALPYKIYPINIGNGEQFDPSFLAISPNNKIPAIIDHDNGLSLFESGAILIYLGEKSGQFYPQTKRHEINQWLMWQMSALGPMLGRAHYFLHFNPKLAPAAGKWFAEEARRLYGILDKLLSDQEFMCRDYSIADIASFPWVILHQWQKISLDDYPYVKAWYQRIAARHAVQRGYKILDAKAEIPPLT